MTAVIINAIVAAGNNYRKEKQFRALQSQIDQRQTLTVVRSGTLKQIPADELLVGDVFALKDGKVWFSRNGFLVNTVSLMKQIIAADKS